MSTNGVVCLGQKVLTKGPQNMQGADTDNDEYYSIAYLQSKIAPGKILEFRHGPHTHFALYIGYGKVMNIIVEDGSSKQAHIRICTIREVCHDGKARIRNHDDVAQTHFQLKARPSEEIVHAAMYFNDQVVPFEFDFRNCEYYCTLWRYGKGFSTMVANHANSVKGGEYDKYKQE